MRESVLESQGLLHSSSAPALETFLQRQSGIHSAQANYLSDSVTVRYDETVISEAELRRHIQECGYHCRGEVLPRRLCTPEPNVHAGHAMPPEHAGTAMPAEHAGHRMTSSAAPAAGEMAQMAHGAGDGLCR